MLKLVVDLVIPKVLFVLLFFDFGLLVELFDFLEDLFEEFSADTQLSGRFTPPPDLLELLGMTEAYF